MMWQMWQIRWKIEEKNIEKINFSKFFGEQRGALSDSKKGTGAQKIAGRAMREAHIPKSIEIVVLVISPNMPEHLVKIRAFVWPVSC